MFSILTNIVVNFMPWLLLAVIVILFRATKKDRRLRLYGFIILLVMWLLGTRPIAEVVLWPLEKYYKTPSIDNLKEKGLSQVVVLTGGGYPAQGELNSFSLPHASIYRFLAGMELCERLGPDCHLIFSGAAGRNQRDVATAEIMKKLALILNPKVRVSAESYSGSTSEHPLNVKLIVGKQPFVLVTSAYHMPRSMRTFRKAGLNPIPYPVDFLIQGNYHWDDWLPSAESFWKLNVGFREYLALALYTVKGW